MLESPFIYISPTDRAFHTPPSRSPLNLPRPLSTETALRKVRRVNGKDKEKEKKAGKGSDLVIKFTNLVSTNLNNTVGGGGVPYVAHLADPPDYFVHCVPTQSIWVESHCWHGDGTFSPPPTGRMDLLQTTRRPDGEGESCESRFSVRLVQLCFISVPP